MWMGCGMWGYGMGQGMGDMGIWDGTGEGTCENT